MKLIDNLINDIRYEYDTHPEANAAMRGYKEGFKEALRIVFYHFDRSQYVTLPNRLKEEIEKIVYKDNESDRSI